MPTYQYACTACEESLEVVQSFSDASLTECPACGGRLRKKYGAVGVVFKGSGFYKNDSRSEGAAKKADAGSSEPKTDAPRTDAPRTDAPKTDSPKVDAPKKDAPAKPSAPTASSTSTSAA